MSTMTLPGFRGSCLTLATIYVFLAGSILVRGPMNAMADYGVPPATLASPHYADAMFWVFLHMTMIGLTIGLVGWFAEGVRMQRAFARLMLAGIVVYTYLDVRAADWIVGTGLYRGRGSLGPVLVDVLAVALWVRLNVVAPRAAAHRLGG
jgi:hypothetical protein